MYDIYLAGPFFNKEEIENINKVKTFLRNKGYSVFVPQEHFIKDGENLENHIWGKRVFDMDIKAINNSKALFVVYYGIYSDSGTAWEIGYAYAKNIPIYIYHITENISSLMISNGCLTNLYKLEEFDYDYKKLNSYKREQK